MPLPVGGTVAEAVVGGKRDDSVGMTKRHERNKIVKETKHAHDKHDPEIPRAVVVHTVPAPVLFLKADRSLPRPSVVPGLHAATPVCLYTQNKHTTLNHGTSRAYRKTLDSFLRQATAGEP